MKIYVYRLSPSFILYRVNNQVFLLHEKGITIRLDVDVVIVPRFLYIQVLRGLRIAKRLGWLKKNVILRRVEMYQLPKHIIRYYMRTLKYGDRKNMALFNYLNRVINEMGVKK